jgi:hypothetical protein
MMLAADVIDRLIDFAGADKGGSAVDLRHARRALQDALRASRRCTPGSITGRMAASI